MGLVLGVLAMVNICGPKENQMPKQPKNKAPDERGLESAYDYLEFSLRERKKIADEAEDERVRLRALAHVAKISAGLVR